MDWISSELMRRLRSGCAIREVGGFQPFLAEEAVVTTRGEGEEAKAVDGAELNTRDVTEGLGEAVVVGVHNEGPTAHHVAAVTHLTLAAADVAAVPALLDIRVGADRLE